MSHVVSASEGLRGYLSEHALEVLDRLHVERDLRLTGGDEALRHALDARAWPRFEPAFDLERAAGGVLLAKKTRLGAFSASMSFEARPALRLLHFEGTPLLPVDGSEMPELWMGPDGVLYRGVQGDLAGGDEGDDVAPLYQSWHSFFERFAFQRETWLSADAAVASLPYFVDTHALVGGSLASALKAARFEAACDRFAQVYDDQGAHVQELVAPGYRVGTRAWVASPDALVTALVTIADRAPGLPIRFGGPRLAPPRPDEAIVHAVDELDSHTGQKSRICIAGGPGDWRVARVAKRAVR